MKKKILVLGYFGFVTNQLDGQTIKTRNVYNLLKSKKEQLGKVIFFDTQQFQKNILSVFTMLKLVLKTKKLIYIPAHGNLKYIFPFLFLISKVIRIEILYIVVGGWLYEYLKNKPIHRYFLKRISGIFPQNKQLVEKLKQDYGFQNVNYFPNFRIHSFVPKFENNKNYLKIVFMARINRMKGIDYVFRLAEYLDKNPSENKPIIIDFYGPIEKNDNEHFQTELKKHYNTKYKGQIEPDKIHQTLSQYDVMVLPTKYYTEGFPGSILDAYISGIPVIVTQWKHATEFVDNGKCGFIVPFENGGQVIIDRVLELYNNNDLLIKMKQNAYTKSKEYSTESAWKIIKHYL